MKRRKKNFYERLNIDPTVDQPDINRAYRNTAKNLHPDRNPNDNTSEEMKDVNEAYAVLSDPTSRRDYDQNQGFNSFRQTPSKGGDQVRIHVRTDPPAGDSFDNDRKVSQQDHTLLTFSVSDQFFAAHAHRITGTSFMMPLINPAGNLAHFIHWYVFRSGKKVPVIDLHRVFHKPLHAQQKGSHIIYTNIKTVLCGFIVDTVLHEFTVPEQYIQHGSLHPFFNHDKLVSGVIYNRQLPIPILDFDHIFNRQDLDVLLKTTGIFSTS